jgi:hypothetical protein
VLRSLSVTVEGSSGWRDGCLEDPGCPVIELDDESIVHGVARVLGRL